MRLPFMTEIISETGAPAELEERIAQLVRSGLAAVGTIEPAARERLFELAERATARRY